MSQSSLTTGDGSLTLLQRLFFRPVDTASLAVFRMMFGALLLFEAVNYGVFLCLDCLYRDTELLFKYPLFGWVHVLPEPWFRLSYALLGVAAIGVITGTFYRLSIILCTLIFSYHFLLDQALYLNHFYMAILISVILCFVPAHRLWSVDAWRKPALRAERVPNWGRFWLGAQLEIILIYAGLVKITHDWLNLEPMRLWMNNRSHDEIWLFQWLTQDWGIALASYGAIALHLIGAPLLLFRRTRLVVFCLYAVFHLTNAMVFDIGIFPFMTLAATLLLFDPDWPRQVASWLRQHSRLLRGWRWLKIVAAPAAQSQPSHPDGGLPARRSGKPTGESPDESVSGPVTLPQPVSAGSGQLSMSGIRHGTLASFCLIGAILAWLSWQSMIPLRHHIAPGNVAWNEDGHQFSWRMKLRSKSGTARFIVIKGDGRRIVVDPADHLNRKQTRTMACLPDLIWQFAQYLEDIHRDDAEEELRVYAQATCSLNDRPVASLIQPRIDLTAIPRNEPVTNWVTEMTTPLPRAWF